MTSWIKGTWGESQASSQEMTLRGAGLAHGMRARGDGVGHGGEGVMSALTLLFLRRVYANLTSSTALPTFRHLPCRSPEAHSALYFPSPRILLTHTFYEEPTHSDRYTLTKRFKKYYSCHQLLV